MSAGRVEWEVGVEVEVGDGVGVGAGTWRESREPWTAVSVVVGRPKKFWPSWSESWIGTCPPGNCLRSWPAPTKRLGGRTHPG